MRYIIPAALIDACIAAQQALENGCADRMLEIASDLHNSVAFKSSVPDTFEVAEVRDPLNEEGDAALEQTEPLRILAARMFIAGMLYRTMEPVILEDLQANLLPTTEVRTEVQQ